MTVEAREYFSPGENVFFLIRNPASDVDVKIYLYNERKFLTKDNNGNFIKVNTPTTFSISRTNFISNGTENFYILTIPRRLLRPYEILNANFSDNTTTKELIVFYGQNFTLPGLVRVYGNLYDARGNPLSGETISFQVLNPTTYFDNSPSTMISTSTSTNELGYFSIELNRTYNYLVVLPRLNYSKFIKLSSLPQNVNEVELVFSDVEALC